MAAFSAPPFFLNETKVVSPTRTADSTTPAVAPIFSFQGAGCCSLCHVKQFHAQLVVSGFLAHHLSAGKLIDTYLSMSNLSYASSVFNFLQSPNVYVYNTMIRGLTLANWPYDSILLYHKMLSSGLTPDNYTFTFVLKACSLANAIFQGKQLHCQIIKSGTPPDTHVHSSLIRMYASSEDGLDQAESVLCHDFPDRNNTVVNNSMISGYFAHGQVREAGALFDEMKHKDTASWSAMVSGYTKNSMYMEALSFFREMIVVGVPANESTVVSALSSCARLGALDQGRWIHAYINRTTTGASVSTNVGTALVDMYAKLGSIGNGYQVFRKMAVRDVVTWGAMISGFAVHGGAKKCFQLFNEMVADGIRPNSPIFVAILSACSHAGYVEAGYHYFRQMVQRYRIKPSMEHYGCMVDLLGRAGRLEEAEKFIKTMLENPNSVIWGSLLAACRTYKDVRRGKHAFMHSIELEPNSGDRYKLAGHMLAASGEQEEALKLRKLIKKKEMETTRGSSLIEVNGLVHEFVAGDIGHDKARKIYEMLEEMERRLEKAGFRMKKEEEQLDTGEEEMVAALNKHSERLALAYGLLSTKEGTAIRIIKNLRVCRDCHLAMKYISRQFGRKIIVRDRTRFHVFEDGECSCLDYW